MKEKIAKLKIERIVANQKIIYKLQEYLKENPGIRFSQMLINLDIINGLDNFYLESLVLLKRLNKWEGK